MDFTSFLDKNIFDGNKGNTNPILSLALYEAANKNLLDEEVSKRIKREFDNERMIEDLREVNELIQKRQTDEGIKSKITMERLYDGDDSITNWCDAVIHYILSLDNVISLFYNGSVMIPNDKTEFEVKNGVYFRLKDLKFKENKLDVITFELVSYTESITVIRDFIKDCQKNYNVQLQREMGESLYYFDQLVVMGNRASYANQTPQSNLLFEKNKFITNRNLKNVFFENKEVLATRVELFKNNKKWYDDRGIPYTLGLMLYGEPGCGKTSTIKALAKVLDRHIVNIQLSHIKTGTQLKKLFYDDKLQVIERENDVNVKNLTIEIPIEKRLYVIEDIDAMTDLIKRRDKDKSANKPVQVQPQMNVDEAYGGSLINNDGSSMNHIISGMNEGPGGYNREDDFGNEKKNQDPITLSSLLNILDGTLEIPGRVLVITTNHPEQIDPALIRPGRIDMQIHYKKANREIIQEMFESFYEKKISKKELEKVEEYKWTPAEVNAVMFRNFFNNENALKELQGLRST
jgi:energy-coupling factor transporter ATP-binding protein EcfA2